jgi:hypothetical protein
MSFVRHYITTSHLNDKKTVRRNYFQKMNICSERAARSLRVYRILKVIGCIFSVLALLLLLRNYQMATLDVRLINFRYYFSKCIPYFIGLDFNGMQKGRMIIRCRYVSRVKLASGLCSHK